MSPNADRFWLAAQRRIATLQPEVQDAILRAFRIIRDSLSEAQLARIIETGNLDRLVAEALDQAMMDRAFLPYRQRIRRVTQRGFDYAVKDLPKGGKIDGTIAIAFDHLSPDVVTAVRALDTKVISSLQADVRAGFLAKVQQGIEAGQNPRTTARQVREIIGMSPTQVQNAAKYRTKLEAQGKTAEQVEKGVRAYEKRAIAVNAEANARTATLDSYKAGQRLSWQQAASQGIVDPTRLTKTWKGVLDSRERPEHVAMQNETVPFDSPFSNGQMVPGDTDFNCRCIAVYRASTT